MNNKALEWLQQWEKLINANDYENARPLFSPDVISFGTVAGFVSGLSELETRQWRKVWPTIKEFKFADPIILPTGEPAHSFVIISRWHSKGREADGGWYDRKGRATLVLRVEGRLLRCCHSHLSMEPGIPPLYNSSSS